MSRIVAVVTAKNKYEAIDALEMLIAKISKEYGPGEEVNERAVVTNEGEDVYAHQRN